MNNSRAYIPRLSFGRHEPANEPFRIVQVDYNCKMINHPYNGYKYILVLECYMCRWKLLVETKDRSAKSAARAFVKQWVKYFGIPCKIVCDNERGLFAKDIVEEIYQLTKMEVHRTIAYVSGGKSLVERTNRTINHALRRLEGRDWPSQLPVIMNTINNIRSATTGFSPSQLALGRSTTLLDYDDGRHRNKGMPAEMPWMDYMSVKG
eukprot:Nk52_evm1s2556 gene=Nk52_evmTU1s2556